MVGSKTVMYGLLATFVGASVLLIPERGETQASGSFVALQGASPGSPQSGNTNILGTARAGQFVGSGVGLFNLNAAGLTSGTLPDARLGENVARLNVAQSFSAAMTFENGIIIPPGAAEGHVLTSNGSGVATWQACSCTLTLPYSGSLISPATGLLISNGGSGHAITGSSVNESIIGVCTGSATWNYAVRGQNNFSGNFGLLGTYGSGVEGIGNGSGVNGTSTAGHGVVGKSSTGYGGYFEVTDAANTSSAVYGFNKALGGLNFGGRFDANALAGTGVFAQGYIGIVANGAAYGGDFQGGGISGIGVRAQGPTRGIYAKAALGFSPIAGEFVVDDTGGTGVLGTVSAATSLTFGVRGIAASSTGVGVRGEATATSGANAGGEFLTSSPEGNGVIGRSTSTSINDSPSGVFGEASTVFGYGVYGRNNATSSSGPATGVHGVSVAPNGYGTFGFHQNANGVGVGSVGQSLSQNGTGVVGYALHSSGTNYGGLFRTNSPNGFSAAFEEGVGTIHRLAANGTSMLTQPGRYFGSLAPNRATFDIPGVIGDVLIWDNLHVAGILTAGTKAFRIDHPLDPYNKFLNHLCVESDEMKNLYDGIIRTDSRGYAHVKVPQWFLAVNENFRYQLTVIEDDDSSEFVMAKVAKKLVADSFVIRTSKPNIEVSWQVTGVRKDAYAKANRLKVEEDKPAELKGRLIHPSAYGVKDPLEEAQGIHRR